MIVLLLAAAVNGSDWKAGFARPGDEHGIGVYWWWFGPAQTRQEVNRELHVMHDAGISYVLVFPLYPLSLDEPRTGIRNMKYLSPDFLNILGYAASQAKALGITMDVLIGSGWPYGGPSVTADHAALKVRAQFSPAGAEGYAVVPKSLPNESLEALLLVRGNTLSVDLDSVRNVLAEANTGRVKAAPGETLVAVFRGPTGMRVKRPSLGAEGLVLDHLSCDAVRKYLTDVGDKLIAAGRKRIRAVHSDSLEVFGQTWTTRFLEEFRRRRGYDLTLYLPALFADAGPLTPDIRHDYWRTVTEVFLDHYAKTLQDWAHQHGIGVQSESYGTPGVDLTGYQYVDYPMGEESSWKSLSASRWASSAAHQYGKRVISAETWTWLRWPRYTSSLQDLKVSADMFLVSGINKFVAHGYAYSPPAAGVPGWGYYASVMLNENNPFWPHFHELSNYLRRASYAMSLGKPKVDVGIYMPEDDVMSEHSAHEHLGLRLEVMKRLLDGNALGAPRSLQSDYKSEAPVIRALLSSGFSFDAFDRSILQPGLNVSAGQLAVGDVAYRIAILPNLVGITLPVLEKLAEFCRNGGTLIATKRLPKTTFGLQDRERNSARIGALIGDLFGVGPVGKTRRHRYGNGIAIFVHDEDAELQRVLLSLAPEVRFDNPDPELAFLHRGDKTRDVYFLANLSNYGRTVRATFRDGRGAPEFWNPLTGKTIVAPMFTRVDDGTEVPLYLEPYGSMVVAFDGRTERSPLVSTNLPLSSLGQDVDGALVARVMESGDYRVESAVGTKHFHVRVAAAPISLNGPWTLRTPNNGSVLLKDLGSWTQIPALKYFSGTIEYRTEIELPPLPADGGYWLDLGEVREIAVTSVNGHREKVRWKAPYRLDISRDVIPGRNEIRVAVTNLMINHVLGTPDPDYSSLEPLRFPPPMEKEMIQEPLPSGLLGRARIIPFVRVKLEETKHGDEK